MSPPEKGDVTPDICKTKPLHGQKCSFVCNAGYTRIGPSFSSCDDGYWIPGSFTVCKGTVTTLRVVEFNDGPFYRLVFYCLTYLAKFFLAITSVRSICDVKVICLSKFQRGFNTPISKINNRLPKITVLRL